MTDQLKEMHERIREPKRKHSTVPPAHASDYAHQRDVQGPRGQPQQGEEAAAARSTASSNCATTT